MLHPIMLGLGKLRVRRKLIKSGKDRSEVSDALDGVTAEMVEAGLPVGTVLPTFEAPMLVDENLVGAFGDGSIIKAIMEFFETPLGQLILKIIEMLAMSFFM